MDLAANKHGANRIAKRADCRRAYHPQRRLRLTVIAHGAAIGIHFKSQRAGISTNQSLMCEGREQWVVRHSRRRIEPRAVHHRVKRLFVSHDFAAPFDGDVNRIASG